MIIELMNVTFESGKLPEGWVEEHRECTFEKGALRSGRVAKTQFVIPGKGWRFLHVEAEVEPIGGAALVCGDGTLDLVVDLKRHTQSIAMYGGLPLAVGRVVISSHPGAYAVAFEYNDGKLSILVDGQKILEAQDPHPTPAAGFLDLEFWDDCLIHRVRVLGDGEVEKSRFSYPARRSKDFFLEVNVDFADDLNYASFNENMFAQLFAEFKSWGVKRCHWIHYGAHQEGSWDNFIGSGMNYQQTFRNVGEIFPAAVRAAHAHGVQIFGMFKPFETGFFHSYGESTPEAHSHAKTRYAGGALGMIANFCVKHPELMMARKPGVYGPGTDNEVFTRIDLVKEDDCPAAFGVNEMELFVSDDNTTYRPYEGPIVREEVVEDYPVWEHTASGGRSTDQKRRARILRLKNLQIRCKYVALSVNSRVSSFTNTLINLIHVFGEKDEERRLTYGYVPRAPHWEPDVNGGMVVSSSDFRKVGIEFDVNHGTPSCVFAGDFISRPYAIDSYDGILAIARGKERSPIGRPSPSYPQVRDWWNTWVRHCLDAGADGIELRVRNHSYHLVWSEFGFEQPVRDEFLKRYGVDIWNTDDFDKAAWRRLRGEGYTQFIREARQLCRSYGKPLGLHVSRTEETDPAIGAAMEIHWDWRTWLKEGLADSVTMKEVSPGTRLAEEILSNTRPLGIPVIFCPYADNLFRKPGGEEVCAGRIRFAREGGYDGFQLYECAAVIKGTKDGHIIMEQPALREVLQREFAG